MVQISTEWCTVILTYVSTIYFLFSKAQNVREKEPIATYNQCGGNLLDLQGIVTSPNYPSSETEKLNVYAENLDCKWMKASDRESTLYRVKIWDMSLENGPASVGSNETRCYDFLNVTMPSIGTRQFCSWQAPKDIVEGVGKHMILHFHSDGSENFRGFMLTYKTTLNHLPCLSSPCINGKCNLTDDKVDYKCVCFDGYTGTNCDVEINECDSNPCQNGGSCSEVAGSGFICRCTEDWQGTFCDAVVIIDPCLSNPCHGESTCEQVVENQFRCICSSGFTGETCSEDIDECASNPCLNDGNCTNSLNHFQCSCVPGWVGNTCNTSDSNLCFSNPCGNQEVCEMDTESEGYRCFCKPGFEGKDCERTISNCEYDSCLNGGVCFKINSRNWFRCKCKHGYTGYKCEKLPPQCENPGIPYLNHDIHWTYGSILKFYCTEGYRLLGAENLTCLENTKWNNEMPACVVDGKNSMAAFLPNRHVTQMMFLVSLCITTFLLMVIFSIWLFVRGPWQFRKHLTKVVKLSNSRTSLKP